MRKYDMPFPLQMIISLHIGLNVLFLLLQEKGRQPFAKVKDHLAYLLF